MIPLLLLAVTVLQIPQDLAPITGVARDPGGQPLAGALVTASDASGVEVTVVTDAAGRFTLRPFSPGPQTVRVRRADIATVEIRAGAGETVALRTRPAASATHRASDLLGLLPDGEAKRRFVLDCTGCHQFDERTILSPDRARLKTGEEWRARTAQMLQFAGAASAFPIMSASRDADSTAAWLTRHLGGSWPPPSASSARSVPSAVVITEYPLPAPADLPHDLIVGPDGRVVITGMTTHRMYVLDPATGVFVTDSIPVPAANPRAVEVAPDGTWWVLLGFPRKVARRDPAGSWTTWDIGMYPHSIGLAADGRVWFNGHFSRDPELLGSLDPATGAVTRHAVPSPPMADGGSTIPYELRVAPDGAVWVTQLTGGRLVRFDPRSGDFRLRALPTPFSGPRRMDLDADGVAWIPEYANNRLARYDPARDALREWELPVSDALPYVVRVDRDRNLIWIGTGAADALFRFDPATEQFTTYPLPTRGALVRHIDVDRSTGDVWLAYGASPGQPPAKVARVRAGVASR